jgi:hypothetical protein
MVCFPLGVAAPVSRVEQNRPGGRRGPGRALRWVLFAAPYQGGGVINSV